ncbi:MAG: hypothetical protein WB791_00160 [Waddliaceae bacterium]
MQHTTISGKPSEASFANYRKSNRRRGKHSDDLAKIRHKLIPLTHIYRDSQQREIQLWNSEKYGLIGAVHYPDGKLVTIPGSQINNPLGPSDDCGKLIYKLEQCGLRVWDLAFDVHSSTITVWPHLIAAGKDDGLKFYQGYNPFARRTREETIEYLKSNKAP